MLTQTIIDFIGNLTHSAGPAARQPFILREAAQVIVAAQRFVDTLSAAAPQVDMGSPAGGAAVKTYAVDEPATAVVAKTF